MANILDLSQDVLPYFGICQADNPDAYQLLMFLVKATESQAKRFVGHGIAQATYTEFQRKNDIGTIPSCSEISVVGQMVYPVSESVEGHILQLDNGYVRSITSLYEDPGAYFGAKSGDFAASTQLTNGEQFYLELDATGLSVSGRVIRAGRSWSSSPGTIKVTYVAGLTAAELNGEHAYVKEALLEDLRQKFNFAWNQRGSGGMKKKERWVGDYEVEYDTSATVNPMDSLTDGARKKLWPIKRIVL